MTVPIEELVKELEYRQGDLYVTPVMREVLEKHIESVYAEAFDLGFLYGKAGEATNE